MNVVHFHERRHIALEALRQAVNMRLAGEVTVRSENGASETKQAHDSCALGSVAILVTDAECANGVTSADIVTKLLTVTNPHAVGM